MPKRKAEQDEGPNKKRPAPESLSNWIGGEKVGPTTGDHLPVECPLDGSVICRVPLSGEQDVANAVAAAKEALPAWQNLTVKARALIMFRFHQLMEDTAPELCELVTMENGKNLGEAMGSVAKGNETVEWACSLPQLIQDKILTVSRGVECREFREPLGIVASIVPFNFPIMVPMWTVPIALTMGNCVILKPSEKVPMTMTRVAELLHQAGVPKGVFQIVHGAVPVVNAICDHPDISAVSFVGSSRVAEIVAKRCRNLNKKVLALGGAKNHLVALPDCDQDMVAQDIVASFAGCAGQRCMAASVLILVGDTGNLLDKITARAAALEAGREKGCVGSIIDKASRDRILGVIDDAEKNGAKVVLDGRGWKSKDGYWVGPTILRHSSADDAAIKTEIFGPVLSVLQVSTWQEALDIEAASEFGNAASIYTSVGAHADFFSKRFRAGMIGVNIGVPVPREPFSFGGMYGTCSKYGDYDITGQGAMEFFSNVRKITTKWAYPDQLAAKATQPQEDAASFVGQM